LRSFKKGFLKTSSGPDGPLLPINTDGKNGTLVNMANPARRVAPNRLFAAGDPRANDNPVLLSLHTLFVREHNRIANDSNYLWTDEIKWADARRWVIAFIQAITFQEYLPTLLGAKTVIPPYKYNASANPQVNAFFSTVSFRYGHDEVSGVISRYDSTGRPYKDGNILLRDSYFFPDSVRFVGIGPYLRGAAVSQQNAVDAMIDEDLRTFLFNQAQQFATDLAARNMQRGRDHGIARYNDCRRAFGLSTCQNFACVNSDPRIVNLLQQAYGNASNAIDNLDPYVGGLLEPKLSGSNLGALFTASILEQLVRIRNADSMWYEKAGIFEKDELNVIRSTKLSDIIKRNTNTPTLPSEVFVRDNISPEVALGADKENHFKFIIAIIIPTVLAAILIIIIIGMCFQRKKEISQNDNYSQNLLEK